MSKNRKSHLQMSETLINAIFLTLSGGFQDAYTYCLRGEVFANAQTGNIVLMSSYLFKGEFLHALHYLVPLCSFAAGIFIAELIHLRYKQMRAMHWRQFVLLAEIVLLFTVGFMPESINMTANSLVSFVCAMQVQSFRSFNGNAYASTMCIGNIRSGTAALCKYFHTREKSFLRSSLDYFIIVFIFAIGAGMGSVITKLFGIRAIWFSCLLLTVSLFIMQKRFASFPDDDI